MLIIERHVPQGKYPERLSPVWVSTKGSKIGKNLAASHLIDVKKWEEMLTPTKYGQLFSKPEAKVFWQDFANDILAKKTPPCAMPDDPHGSSQLEKLIDYMVFSSTFPQEGVLGMDSLPDEIATRDEQFYIEPYSGAYIEPAKRNTKYVPELGQNVMVNVIGNCEGIYHYNPTFVPEPAKVIAVDNVKSMIEVGNLPLRQCL